MNMRLLYFTLMSLLVASSVWAENKFWIEDIEAEPGDTVTVGLLMNMPFSIAGVSFTVLFDKSALQITSVANGTDAFPFTQIETDLEKANTGGELKISLVDFSFANPIPAGENRQVFDVTFVIDEAACGIYKLKLEFFAASDTSSGDYAMPYYDGSIKVFCKMLGDINEDGDVNIMDLLALLEILSGM